MFLRQELSKSSEYMALSRRQLEVLRCIWDGFHSKEICARLDLNVKGVEFHRRNIVKKWECDNVIQAIRLALRRGILEM